MRLTINLASRPYYHRRRMSFILLSLVVLLAGCLVAGGFRLADSNREVQRLSQGIARMAGQNRTETAALSGSELLQKRATVLHKLALRQTTPLWLDLLNTLESVVPPGVNLSKLESTGTNELSIEGNTRTFGDLQRLLEQLDRSDRFRDTTLVSHKEQLNPELGRLVQFMIKTRIVAP